MYDYNPTYLCDISNTFVVSDLEKARHIVAWWEKEKSVFCRIESESAVY